MRWPHPRVDRRVLPQRKAPERYKGVLRRSKQFPKARGRSHGFGTESFGCCVAVAAGCAAYQSQLYVGGWLLSAADAYVLC